jgi:hypothetical protein
MYGTYVTITRPKLVPTSERLSEKRKGALVRLWIWEVYEAQIVAKALLGAPQDYAVSVAGAFRTLSECTFRDVG